MSTNDENNEAEVIGFLGVGLDNKDGHVRVTRGDEYVLLGGSAETHERMQEKVARFAEAIQKHGKPWTPASIEEILGMTSDEWDDD